MFNTLIMFLAFRKGRVFVQKAFCGTRFLVLIGTFLVLALFLRSRRFSEADGRKYVLITVRFLVLRKFVFFITINIKNIKISY